MVIIQIVPRLPPSIDGLGDYALNLARQICKDFGIETDFVVGDSTWTGATEIEEFPINKVSVCSATSLFSLLPSDRPATVLLHYVGYGYAKRGCPTWLVNGLQQWRTASNYRSLVTMFHKIYASGPPWTSTFWLSRQQRHLASRLAQLNGINQMKAISFFGDNTQLVYSRTKYELRSFLSLYPKLFFPLIQLKSTSRKLAVGKHTELVIEGFPRSANSFAVGAFEAAQLKPVSVATHLHAPAQIILAARKNIPTLVLIRKPIDAVISLRSLDLEVNSLNPSRSQNLTIEQLLKNYINFYTSIMPYKDKYVLGCFEKVTSNFGSVIKRINERYNTSFALFEHTEENVIQVFQKQGIHAGPSSKRQEIKALVNQEVETDEVKALIFKAENVYNQLKQLVG